MAQQFWWKSIFVYTYTYYLANISKFLNCTFLGFSEYCVHGGSMSKSPIVIRDGNTSMVALNPFFYFFDFFLWGRTRQHTKVGESESQCLPIGLFMAWLLCPFWISMFVQYGNRTLTFCSRNWMMVGRDGISYDSVSSDCAHSIFYII